MLATFSERLQPWASESSMTVSSEGEMRRKNWVSITREGTNGEEPNGCAQVFRTSLALVRVIGVEYLTVLRRTVDLQGIFAGDYIDKPPVHATREPAIGHLAFGQRAARFFLPLPDGPLNRGLAILDTPAKELQLCPRRGRRRTRPAGGTVPGPCPSPRGPDRRGLLLGPVLP